MILNEKAIATMSVNEIVISTLSVFWIFQWMIFLLRVESGIGSEIGIWNDVGCSSCHPFDPVNGSDGDELYVLPSRMRCPIQVKSHAPQMMHGSGARKKILISWRWVVQLFSHCLLYTHPNDPSQTQMAKKNGDRVLKVGERVRSQNENMLVPSS